MYIYMVCLHSAGYALLTKKYALPQLWGGLSNPAWLQGRGRLWLCPLTVLNLRPRLNAAFSKGLSTISLEGRENFTLSVRNTWAWILSGWGLTAPRPATSAASAFTPRALNRLQDAAPSHASPDFSARWVLRHSFLKQLLRHGGGALLCPLGTVALYYPITPLRNPGTKLQHPKLRC